MKEPSATPGGEAPGGNGGRLKPEHSDLGGARPAGFQSVCADTRNRGDGVVPGSMDWHGPFESDSESVGSLSSRTTATQSDMSECELHLLRYRYSRPQPVDRWTLLYHGTRGNGGVFPERAPAVAEMNTAVAVTATRAESKQAPAWLPIGRCCAAHPLQRASFVSAFSWLCQHKQRFKGQPVRMVYAKQRLSRGMDSMGYEIMQDCRIVYFQVCLHGSQLRLVGINGVVKWCREIPIGSVYTSEEFCREVKAWCGFRAVSFQMGEASVVTGGSVVTEAALGILRAICPRDRDPTRGGSESIDSPPSGGAIVATRGSGD